MNKSTISILATGRSGIGHLRRVTTVAHALRRKAKALDLQLITNAAPAGIACDELGVFDRILLRPRAEMAQVVAEASGILVCDTIELPGIERAAGRKVLILRETPADRIASFRIPGGLWDRVLVPNPRAHWMPDGSALSTSVEPTGWIVRTTGVRRASDKPAGIVVATGGGGTEATRNLLYPILDRLLADTRGRIGAPFLIRQAIGPRAGGAQLAGADEVFDPGGDLNLTFRAADLVITTAGYNSVLELATTDTPALLLPIPRSLDDQAARVRLWGPKLGHGYAPKQHDAAVDWLSAQIARPTRRAPIVLGADGAARAAELILDLL